MRSTTSLNGEIYPISVEAARRAAASLRAHAAGGVAVAHRRWAEPVVGSRRHFNGPAVLSRASIGQNCARPIDVARARARVAPLRFVSFRSRPTSKADAIATAAAAAAKLPIDQRLRSPSISFSFAGSPSSSAFSRPPLFRPCAVLPAASGAPPVCFCIHDSSRLPLRRPGFSLSLAHGM